MPPKKNPFEKIGGLEFTPADFCETLDGGQAFTWYPSENFSDDEPEYEGVFDGRAATIKLTKQREVLCRADDARDDTPAAAAKYLDAERDYASLRQTLASVGDANMNGALKIYPTLRILRQNPAETIVCFICSSSKRIVQIKQCVKLLSEKLGEEIGGGKFALPAFDKIAASDLETISACKLGFRARYLWESAKKIASDNFDPMSLRKMPYDDAKKYLTSLTGIGDKVADCILLFGAARMEAFPVDTWIRQAMNSLYGTPDNPKEIRKFAAERFGKNAGFAQQLIFAAKRKNLI